MASKYEVHATQITKWKKQLLESETELFSRPRQRDPQQAQKALASSAEFGKVIQDALVDGVASAGIGVVASTGKKANSFNKYNKIRKFNKLRGLNKGRKLKILNQFKKVKFLK